MSRFFANQPFFRFAAVATLTTDYPRDQELMAWVMSVLKVRIVEILSRSQARSVALVFEASQRADPLVMEYFGALELEENGEKIPVEYCLLPKSAGTGSSRLCDACRRADGPISTRGQGRHPGRL